MAIIRDLSTATRARSARKNDYHGFEDSEQVIRTLLLDYGICYERHYGKGRLVGMQNYHLLIGNERQS